MHDVVSVRSACCTLHSCHVSGMHHAALMPSVLSPCQHAARLHLAVSLARTLLTIVLLLCVCTDEEEGDHDYAGGIATDATGLASGLVSSLPSGLETPDIALNLRKSSDSVAGTESAQQPSLYTVLEQKKASVGTGLMGTDHVYVLPGQGKEEGRRIGDKKR